MTELEQLIAAQNKDAEHEEANSIKSLVKVIGPADTAVQFKVIHNQEFHQDWWNEADPEGDYFGKGPAGEKQ